MILAYLNGTYVPLSEARVSVLDRGFLFGDGIYEVVRIYDGKFFCFDEHLARLERSLEAMHIEGVSAEAVRTIAQELATRADAKEATLYVQITRGVGARRSHFFPETPVAPTLLAYVQPFEDTKAALRTSGCAVRSYPDLRWGRRDIKSVNLLGNVLAAQAAKEDGVYEAILVEKDGTVTEGSHTNVFIVSGGNLRTMPVSEKILPGVTRKLIVGLASDLGVKVEERAFTLDELLAADEAFLSGTTTEVTPIATCDGKAIGGGTPGPLTRRFQEAYRRAILRD